MTGISENTTGLLTFMQSVNNVLMFGWFGIFILIALTVICFIAFMTSTGDARKSFMGASFISFGMALFLRAMSLIPDTAMFITLIASAVAIGFSYVGRE